MLSSTRICDTPASTPWRTINTRREAFLVNRLTLRGWMLIKRPSSPRASGSQRSGSCCLSLGCGAGRPLSFERREVHHLPAVSTRCVRSRCFVTHVFVIARSFLGPGHTAVGRGEDQGLLRERLWGHFPAHVEGACMCVSSHLRAFDCYPLVCCSVAQIEVAEEDHLELAATDVLDC